jgi:hypothetical protein
VPAQLLKPEPVNDEQARAAGLRQAKHVRADVAGQRGEERGGQVGKA